MATIQGSVAGGNWNASTAWVGGVVPTASDDVQLVSTSGPITINVASVCRSLDCTGYTNTLLHSANQVLTIGTSTAGLSNIALKLVSGMTYTLGNPNYSSSINFATTSSTVQTINFGGKTTGIVIFDGVGANWQLVSAHTSVSDVTLSHGTLDTNGQTCTWQDLLSSSNNTRGLTLGTTILTLTGSNGFSFGAATVGLTLGAASSTIILSGSNAVFSGNNGKQYGTVNFTGTGTAVIGSGNITSCTRAGGDLSITGSVTIPTLTYQGEAVARAFTITAGKILTTTASGFLVNGSAGKLISLVSGTSGTPFTLSVPSGTVNVTYLSIKDSTASGGASFVADSNSVNVSGNTGWTFGSPIAPTVTDSVATSVTGNQATGNGNVTADGGSAITERGFVLDVNANPTVANTKFIIIGTTGSFTGSLSGLSVNTTYHYRAYAINTIGTSYGTDQSFTTPANAPTVTGTVATSITQTSAIGNGNVTSDGGGTISERGIVWATSANPTTANSKQTALGTTGAFTASMSGLTQLTTYHYRAYAINATGTSYGADQTFTTLGVAPTVTDSGATFIDKSTAVLNGNVTSDGGTAITERGFVLDIVANPTTGSNLIKSIVNGTTGLLTAYITGLISSTTYHFIAYAINPVGTSYGLDQSFTTAIANTPSRTIDSNFGLNINQEFQSGPYPFNQIFPTAQLNFDLAYFTKLGIKNLRMPLKQWGSGNVPPNDYIGWQRTAAAQVKAYGGFNIILGSGQHGSYKPQDWDTFITFVTTDEVPWLIAHGFGAGDTYMIGNENDNGMASDDFVSATRTSNVVTVVYGFKHSMATGDTINGQFLDLSINGFGGFVVTVIDAYTFTFASTGTNGTISGGNIARNYWRNGAIGFQNILKRLATTVKAISGFNMRISYSILQGVTVNNGTPENDSYNISSWATNGKGTIDDMYLNMYSDTATPSTNPSLAFRYFKAEIKIGYNAWGASNFGVSEWNLWQDTSNYPSSTNQSTILIMERLSFMKSLGIKHFFFCYRYYDGGGVEFLNVVKPYNQTTVLIYRDWWYALIGGLRRQSTMEIVATVPTPISSLRKTPQAIVNSKTFFNYGQNWQSGTAFYNSGTTATDLAFFKKIGVTKLRIGTGNLSFADGVAAVKLGVAQCLAAGMRVIVTMPGVSTDALWTQYIIDSETFATWAQGAGVQELQVANEVEASDSSLGGGLTNSIAKVLALGTAIKNGSYFTRTLSYAIAQDKLESTWITGGTAVLTGCLDKLSYNAYGDTLNLQNQTVDDVEWQGKINAFVAVFGTTNFYISEWNLPYRWPFPVSDAVQANQLIARVAYLTSIGIENYFFTYSWTQNSDYYGLLKADGTYRSWTQALFINPTPRAPIPFARGLAGTRPPILIT